MNQPIDRYPLIKIIYIIIGLYCAWVAGNGLGFFVRNPLALYSNLLTLIYTCLGIGCWGIFKSEKWGRTVFLFSSIAYGLHLGYFFSLGIAFEGDRDKLKDGLPLILDWWMYLVIIAFAAIIVFFANVLLFTKGFSKYLKPRAG